VELMNAAQRSPITAFVTAAALLFLYAPLAVVVLFSFHERPSLSFPFTGVSLRWYEQVFASGEFRSAVWNSLLVAIASAATTLVLGTMAAYGLARVPPRYQMLVAVLFFLPITLPGLFIGLSLLVFFVEIRVPLSLITVTVSHIVYVFPYFLLIAWAAVERLDPALEDTAANLGAGPWQVFWKVSLPQIWPVLAGATSLTFALSFDEFVITFFVIGAESTLPMYIWSGLRRTIDPAVNTVSSLLLLLTLALFSIAFAIAFGRQQLMAESITE
jgi:ABC-type spermidine/putrescine transport system permease subunit II